jgi:4a-hydroxytetrahydrobiopterin dehydratase
MIYPKNVDHMLGRDKQMAIALSETEISTTMGSLPNWEYADGQISKTYEFPNYLAGIAFAAAVGTVCEGLNHHPDLIITYRKVTVRLTTHDAGHNITENDITAAKAIEGLGYPK